MSLSRRALTPAVAALLGGSFVAVPSLCAATVCNPCVYVANQLSNDVTVIDGMTNKVLLNLPAGQTPQFLAVNPAGTRVYVSTHGKGTDGLVTVFDTSTYQIIANILVGRNPTGLALNQKGSRLYVANSGDDTVSLIDTKTSTVIGNPLPVGAVPYGVVASHDGHRLYVSAEGAGTVEVVDLAKKVTATIALGGAPTALALNQPGTRLYVADFLSGQARTINTVQLKASAKVPAGAGTIALALSENGNELYAANSGSGTVSVIDTAKSKVTGTILVGLGPHGLALSSTGARLYAANNGSHTVSVINLAKKTIMATVPVDAGPADVALVYAKGTSLPNVPPHLVSAVNGLPWFEPGSTTPVAPGDTIELTVRVPQGQLGVPAAIRYYLGPNLTFTGATSGTQVLNVCQAAAPLTPLPNGVQGNAQFLDCSIADGSKPLLVTATVTGMQAPRDDPYAAVACFSDTNCVPVRMAVQVPAGAVPSIGPQRTAVILASAPDAPPHPYADKVSAANLVFAASNPGSARSYYAQASYGSGSPAFTTIVGATGGEGGPDDVYGPFIVAANGCMSWKDVLLAVGDAVDYLSYERLLIAVNDPKLCGAGGLTTPITVDVQGGQTKTVTESTIYNGMGDTTPDGRIGSTVLHEFGHQLGLGHANGWDCGSAVQALEGTCGQDEYLDYTDVMGSGSYAQFNAASKDALGWLESGRALPIWNSGTYTIHAYEDGAQNTKVLKIPRKWHAPGALPPDGLASGYYYVSYRQPTPPWDDWLATAPAYASGVTVHMDERWVAGNAVLDMTPGSLAGFYDFSDGALAAGQTFTDPATGVSIKVTAVSPGAATVEVTIPPRATRFLQAASTDSNGAEVPGAIVQGTGNVQPGAIVTATAVAPQGYYFGLWEDSQGKEVAPGNPYTFQLDEDVLLWAIFLPKPPPNDDFAAAEALLSLPAQYTLYTKGASTESGEPTNIPCGAMTVAPGATVWYSYTAPDATKVQIDTWGSDYYTTIAVFEGGALDTLTLIPNGCSFDGPNADAKVTFTPVPGTTYYVQVGAVGGAQNLKVTFSPAP